MLNVFKYLIFSTPKYLFLIYPQKLVIKIFTFVVTNTI